MNTGPKKIAVELTHDGIADAIKQMKIVRAMTKTNCVLFRVRVAEEIKEIANTLYNYAWYNDIVGGSKTYGEDLPAIYMSIENTEDYTALVVDSHVAVFIEFGAGVTYNTGVGSSPHPWGEALGLTIGNYPPILRPPYYDGKNPYPSHGAGEMWYVKSEHFWTRGTPSQKVLYEAVKLVEPRLEDIAKEVFKYD